MPITNPATITIDGVAHDLVRINQDDFKSTYLKKAAGLELQMNIRHSYEGKVGPTQMERHNVELIKTTWDGLGNPVVRSSFITFRMRRGEDPAIAVGVLTGLRAWVNTNSTALAGWES